MRPQRWQPTRLSRPWDSPGKNTAVGCNFLLQCMKVKSQSEVAQSCPTLTTPWTAAHQASLSMRFSRQGHWSGLPFPSPKHESEKWKWSHSVMPNSSRSHGLQPTRLLHPWRIPKRTIYIKKCYSWKHPTKDNKMRFKLFYTVFFVRTDKQFLRAVSGLKQINTIKDILRSALRILNAEH